MNVDVSRMYQSAAYLPLPDELKAYVDEQVGDVSYELELG